MNATLTSLKDGQEHVLLDHNLVGRGHQASLRVEDASVSREHATIQRDGMIYWLRDNSSANGTMVNGVAATVRQVLRSGDNIQFGSCEFVFDQPTGEQPDAAHSENDEGVATSSLPLRVVRATILVGDLQNYTGISAQLKSRQVCDMVREWYDDCHKVLKPRGAIIDKFLGDGVIAYWPGDTSETRFKAAEAAKLLSGPDSKHTPQRDWLRESRDINVQCRIGLNIGGVAQGPLQSGVNTIVGNAITVARGIEAYTRKLDVPMLASRAFLEGWPEGLALFRSVGKHQVKGCTSSIELFTLNEFHPG